VSPAAAFRIAATARPEAGAGWRERLRGVSLAVMAEVVERVPTARMSGIAKRFAMRMLELNRTELLAE
jgi:hypothetical protein